MVEVDADAAAADPQLHALVRPDSSNSLQSLPQHHRFVRPVDAASLGSVNSDDTAPSSTGHGSSYGAMPLSKSYSGRFPKSQPRPAAGRQRARKHDRDPSRSHRNHHDTAPARSSSDESGSSLQQQQQPVAQYASRRGPVPGRDGAGGRTRPSPAAQYAQRSSRELAQGPRRGQIPPAVHMMPSRRVHRDALPRTASAGSMASSGSRSGRRRRRSTSHAGGGGAGAGAGGGVSSRLTRPTEASRARLVATQREAARAPYSSRARRRAAVNLQGLASDAGPGAGGSASPLGTGGAGGAGAEPDGRRRRGNRLLSTGRVTVMSPEARAAFHAEQLERERRHRLLRQAPRRAKPEWHS